MAYVIDQVLILLDSDPGRLVYHIILASAIAGSLLVVADQRSRILQPYQRRIWTGLSALLFLQIAQYILSGLVWQGILFLENWLPVLDRFVVLLSALIIAWLWAFPKPSRLADRFTAGFCLLAGAAALLSAIAWQRLDLSALISSASGDAFRVNGSQVDWAFQLAVLTVLAAGFFGLIANRPAAWGYGALMLGLLAAGHLAHLRYLPYGDNYPAFARLFYLAGFPLLITLPLREISRTAREDFQAGDRKQVLLSRPLNSEHPPVETGLFGNGASLLEPLLDLLENHSDSHSYQQIVTILAQTAGSDYVFLISPPDENEKNRLLSGFTRQQKRLLEEIEYDSHMLPILNSCLKMGRIRNLAPSSSSPDRLALAKTFKNEITGPILFIPVLSRDEIPLMGIVLASADADKYWSTKQEDEIGLFARFLVYTLVQAQEIVSIRRELVQARKTALALHEQAQQAFLDRQKMSDTLTVLEEDAHLSQGELYKSSSQFEGRTSLEQVVQHLQTRNQLLQDTLQVERLNADQNIEQLREDLQSALEEVAALSTISTGPDLEVDRTNPVEIAPQPED